MLTEVPVLCSAHDALTAITAAPSARGCDALYSLQAYMYLLSHTQKTLQLQSVWIRESLAFIGSFACLMVFIVAVQIVVPFVLPAGI